jgi:hypothetical protein
MNGDNLLLCLFGCFASWMFHVSPPRVCCYIWPVSRQWSVVVVSWLLYVAVPWDFCRGVQFCWTGVGPKPWKHMEVIWLILQYIPQILTLMSQILVLPWACFLANRLMACWVSCAPRGVLPWFGQVS